MARPRRNPNQLGPQQDPRNIGQNRTASMRGNNRRQGAFSPAQGGLSNERLIQPPGVAPQQGQCPVGQISKPGPDGRATCVPDPRQPNAAVAQRGQVAPRQTGAGVPTGVRPPRNREGY
jgi:hypothetical protein